MSPSPVSEPASHNANLRAFVRAKLLEQVTVQHGDYRSGVEIKALVDKQMAVIAAKSDERVCSQLLLELPFEAFHVC